MKRKTKYLYLREILIFSFLITIFVLRSILFSKYLIGHSIDWTVPSTSGLIAKSLRNLFFFWTEGELGSLQFAVSNLIPVLSPFYFFGILGYSNALVSRLMLFTTIFLSTVSFYLFLKYFLFCYWDKLGLSQDPKKNEIVILISSLVYTFSPFLFVEIIFGSSIQFLTFAILPLCIYTYLCYLKENKFIYLVLSVFISIFVNASTQNIVILNIFLLFFSLIEKKILKYFLYLSIFLPILSFWIFPSVNWLIFASNSVISDVSQGSSYLKIVAANITKSIFGSEYFFANRNTYLASLPNSFFYIWYFNRLIFFMFPLILGIITGKKKNKNLLIWFLIGFLLVIFFIKGGNEPLGGVNIFLYKYISLFALFRSLQHYQVVYTFFTAIFFALGWIWILEVIKSRTLRKGILSVIFLSFIIYSFPWLASGDIGTKTLKEKNKDHLGLYRLSPGYERLYDVINKDGTDFRLFNVPLSHSPVYLETQYQDKNQGGNVDNGILRPSLTTSVSNQNINELANLLDKDISQQISTNNTLHILGLLNFKFLVLKGDILPHFNKYASSYDYANVSSFIKRLNFLNLQFEEDYVSLYKISDENFLPHFYIPQKSIYWKGEIRDLVEILDLKDYELRSEILLDTGEEKENLLSQLDEGEKEIFIKSFPVDLIQDKELGTYKSSKKLESLEAKISPGSLIYPLALKKEEFDLKSRKTLVSALNYDLSLAEKRISEFLFFGSGKPDSFGTFLYGYTKAIDSAVSVLEEMKLKKDEGFLESLAKFQDSLTSGEKRIKRFSFGGGVIEEIEKYFNNYDLKIKGLKPIHDFTKSVYQFNLPKNEEYEIYIKDTGVGETGVSLDTEGSWKLLDTKYFNQGENEYRIENSDSGVNLVTDSLKINDFTGDTVYRVSLRYRSDGDRSLFSVNQSQEGKLFDYYLPKTGNELTDFEMFFRSSEDADRAFITLSVPEYEDLKIEKIRQPEIMLRATGYQLPAVGNQSPKITFAKVNPTKYRILIEGAKEPYSVVFSESFHKGWKAYVSDQRSVNSERYGEVVASYFDGEIKEGTHRMNFLEKATFETWGKKPLPEERHYFVNGYANSWRILPADTGGQENYELIVEFEPQRLYYIGLFVSLTTLGTCFVIMISSVIRKKKLPARRC